MPLALLLAGCGEKMPDGPRVPTTPVTGIVIVDGKPAEMVSVKCVSPETPPNVPTPSAFTDKDGKFSLSTFETGDGAPPAEYKLTFTWGQFNLLNGQYGGPDKLNGQYDKADKSPFDLSVAGTPVDVGTIELKTK